MANQIADDMSQTGTTLTQMYTRNDPCLCNLGNLLSDMTTVYYKGKYDAHQRRWLNSNTMTGLRVHSYLVGRYDDIVATLCADSVGVDAARSLLSTLNNLGPPIDDGKQQQPEGVDRERAHAAAVRFMGRVKNCVLVT